MRYLLTFSLTVLYAVIVFSANTFANGKEVLKDESYLKRAFHVVPVSLESNYPGIVESTIYNVVLLKKYYPEGNYSKVVDRLNEIAEENPDASIRYKAHLASIYISLGDVIDVTPVSHSFDREYIFRQISEQLNSKLLISAN